MAKLITKETINRLLKDVKQIRNNPLTDNGIYYIHDDEDMLKGYALIIGPSETPYFGGFYFFEFSYPFDYPHSPPSVKYCTNGERIRFNPNLYVCGKVCVSVLNTWRGEQWTSCQTITTILLTLCTLLCKDPLLNEPGVSKKHTEFGKYTKIIEYKNIDIAMFQMILKKPGIYPEKFEIFYPIIKEVFWKNADDVLKYLSKSAETVPVELCIMQGYYNNMAAEINYPKLYDEFKNYCDTNRP